MGRDEASECSAGEEVGYVLAVNRNREPRERSTFGETMMEPPLKGCVKSTWQRAAGSGAGSEEGGQGWRCRSVSAPGGS